MLDSFELDPENILDRFEYIRKDVGVKKVLVLLQDGDGNYHKLMSQMDDCDVLGVIEYAKACITRDIMDSE